jgi:hypothetical protein
MTKRVQPKSVVRVAKVALAVDSLGIEILVAVEIAVAVVVEVAIVSSAPEMVVVVVVAAVVVLAREAQDVISVMLILDLHLMESALSVQEEALILPVIARVVSLKREDVLMEAPRRVDPSAVAAVVVALEREGAVEVVLSVAAVRDLLAREVSVASVPSVSVERDLPVRDLLESAASDLSATETVILSVSVVPLVESLAVAEAEEVSAAIAEAVVALENLAVVVLAGLVEEGEAPLLGASVQNQMISSSFY